MRYVLRILGLTVLSLEVEQDDQSEDDQPDNEGYVSLDAETGLSPTRNFGFGTPFTTHEYDWNAD